MKENLSILYVEDDAMNRKVMQMLLRGVMKLEHVTIFEDSSNFMAKALEISPKPDVILLDIHVNPIDGFEMLRLLHESEAFQSSRIVAITASVMNEEVARLQSAGFDGCIAKPLDKHRFPTLLESIINGDKVWNISS